ncbi:3'(2'),5'-bisphosphate nucleotidase CysQ [Methyloceanibacter sp.]|uniref:3'(2'),5'-bisphosphate nucleotidase CysQ n=1 Tax=Methyloceanibacter sp. TaxID=1965321 RepID=UPI002D70A9C2|nr:3'(2'),5'-bisphosphate nucleotidase CysQ [Methyloceanibacter sp.]HZP08813.1 3'(2'),5'-bisphosphate nucleotidase CysQ [Methyloceanibacter sp.]
MTGQSAPFDFAKAAAVLTDTAARAGAAIMRYFHGASEFTLKGDASPVTLADTQSEAIVVAALKQFAPGIPIVSEEALDGKQGECGERFFLVDPLDGTKEFIKKRSDFTVNVALIDHDRPVFGLVYAPARSLLAVTIAPGHAIEAELPPSASGADLAALEQKKLEVRTADPEGLTALVSLSHLDPETEAFLAKLKIAKRSGAGSSVKFLEIARGQADVYPRFGPTMEWDTAAGQAVLEAAGGKVLTTNGEPLRYGKTSAGLRNPSFIAWGR